MTPLEILIDRGFKPVSDLNYCLAQGTEYFIGHANKKAAIVSLMPEDESIYFIDKDGLRIMAETAKTYGIKDVFLYTNYGVELHSKYELPDIVGINKIIKINSDGFNSK